MNQIMETEIKQAINENRSLATENYDIEGKKEDHDLDSIPPGGWRAHSVLRDYAYENGHIDQIYENALGEENEHTFNCNWIYGNCNCRVESGLSQPLTKNGIPDMRYKSNKNAFLVVDYL